MASSLPPVKAAAFTFYQSLVSQADTDIFKTSVTLAAGDVKVSKDGGAFNNVATLPTEIGTSGVLSCPLSASEMDADVVVVKFSDAAGAEWQDAMVTIWTAAQTLDTTDGVVDGISAVKPDHKPTVEATGEASANVTMQQGVAVAAADANGNVSVVLYGTQPAVTFNGQVKIVASVANEGALDIVNSAAGGIGQRNVGSETGNGAGQRNVGFVGQINDGSAIGQENNSELHGNFSSYGQYNVGPVAQYNEGTTASGVGLELSGGRNAIFMEGSGTNPVIDIQSYGENAAAVRILQYSSVGTAVSLVSDDGDGLLVSGAGVGNVGVRIVGGIDPSLALEATAQAILEDTGTTLPALIVAIESYVTSTTDATAAGSITRRRGDSWSISLTVGSITGYTSLWFTARGDRDAADTDSVLQVKKNASGLLDGLLYVNGAVAATAGLGSITVSDASTGAIIITVDEAVTDDLAPAEIYYDVQVLNGGNVTTLDSGTLTITADVTRAIV